MMTKLGSLNLSMPARWQTCTRTHARTHARTQNMHTPLAMDTEKTEKEMKMKECKAEKGYKET